MIGIGIGMMSAIGIAGAMSGLGALGFALALKYRTVVRTNEVHTVQSKNNTTPYGRGLPAGNVYYKWPESWPRVGVTTIAMPTSIFDIELKEYSAYDDNRLPFLVDVTGFFQVENPETAAQRVLNFAELKVQLKKILQGSIRTILANAPLQDILGERSKFGDAFTKEVEEQLKSWGVKAVKNIELMDIKDTMESEVIDNIMKIKESEIEKTSVVEVSKNRKEGESAIIDADRDIEVRRQEAIRQQGEAEATQIQAVGIANEMAQQEIKEQARETAKKDMAVKKVELEKKAEIDKNVAITVAEQDKETKVLDAEANLIEQQRDAEGVLVLAKADAEGVKVRGVADADAERLILMAPVEATVALAKEIGSNKGYMEYLLSIDGIKAGETVGVAKAEAMKKADMKIITTAGDMTTGVDNMMDVFTPKGGAGLAGMLETLGNTPMGKQLLDKLTGPKTEDTDAQVPEAEVKAMAQSIKKMRG